MTSRQLGLLLVCLVAVTLTVAWIIERQQIRSFRHALDAWGTTGAGDGLGGFRGGGVSSTGGYSVDYPLASSPSVDDPDFTEDE